MAEEGSAAPTLGDEAHLELRRETLEEHRSGNRAAARAGYARLLALYPTDAGSWTNLGALLRSEGRHDLALAAQERAFALRPADRGIINNLANILNDLGEHERALDLRRSLLADDPTHAELRALEGKSLRSLRREAESITRLADARSHHPDHAELQIQLALSQLAAGDYGNGFRNYRARWRTGELTARKMERPEWDGGPLDGKTILVLPEQGFGDALAFARFLPVLRRFNPARVILGCEKPLLRLMQGVEGADQVLPVQDAAHDVWVNMMDLPILQFGEGATAPPPPLRLTIPEDSRAHAGRLTRGHRDLFRVGVVWAGSVTYRANAFRSFSHRQFHALLGIPKVQLFSLYKGPEIEAFRADGSDCLIVDAGSGDRDFADCAAMMEEMDLVITSCTVTAHLAGSLGVPVWTLLHWDAFWMWQLADGDTPWYPMMRLIRQDRPRDWDGVFDRVRADLAARVAASGKAG